VVSWNKFSIGAFGALFVSVLRSFLAFVIGAPKEPVAIQVLLYRPFSSDRRAGDGVCSSQDASVDHDDGFG
jgi:hypothetical protein